MESNQIIAKAKDILIESRELNGILNSTGMVRVPVPPAVSATAQPNGEPTSDAAAAIVTFTLEDTPLFGLRLMVEYEGQKELAA